MFFVELPFADDEPALLELMWEVLDAQGEFDVSTADNGQQAVELCRETHPDLMLMDIKMPLLDGNSACKMLKQDPVTQDTRIILVTAFAQEGTKRAAWDAGADGFVTKPFSAKLLLKAVNDVLNGAERAAPDRPLRLDI